MFGRSKPVVFDPYRGRRRRAGLPGWLWALLIGLVVGGAGVIWAQEQWLPPRLSASATASLRQDFAQASAARDRLQAELASVTAERDEARQARDALQAERDALQARTDAFDQDLGFVVDALPPDPRGGTVAVRAARLSARQGTLDVSLALSHALKPFDGVVQLTASGTDGAGRERSAELQPIALRIAPYQVARARVPLPSGFAPELVTVRVLDKGGRGLGLRIVRVN
jgi:hypothetical protein